MTVGALAFGAFWIVPGGCVVLGAVLYWACGRLLDAISPWLLDDDDRRTKR